MTDILEAIVHTGLGAVWLYLAKECRQSSINQEEEEQKAKEEFRQVREYDPDELADEILNNKQLLSQKSQGRLIDCGKYFVRGAISSPHSLPSKYSKGHDLKLVLSIQRTYDIMATVGEKKVLTNSKTLSSTHKSTASQVELQSLLPKGTWKENRSLQLDNIGKASSSSVVTFVGSKETSLFPGGIDLKTIGIGSVIKIGFEQSEFGIRVGDTLTVYGKVIYDSVNKILKMEKPTHLLTSKEEYENYLTSFNLSTLGVVFFSGLFVAEVIVTGTAVLKMLGVIPSDTKKKGKFF